jgi:hypothetical protein
MHAAAPLPLFEPENLNLFSSRSNHTLRMASRRARALVHRTTAWWMSSTSCPHTARISQIEEKPGMSQFWSGLVKVKEIFYKFCKRIVVSGNKTRFWEDIWHGGKPLSEVFPRLFNLSMNHNVTVQRVVSSFGICLIFRRILWGDLAREWCKLLDIIHGTILQSGDDRVSWSLSDKGFSVKSLYNKL